MFILLSQKLVSYLLFTSLFVNNILTKLLFITKLKYCNVNLLENSHLQSLFSLIFTAKKNFFEAQTMLKICEDHSSGAEEAFEALKDKSKRHGRHKTKESEDDIAFENKTFSNKLATIKKERVGKTGTKSAGKNLINNVPPSPHQKLLKPTSTSSQGSNFFRNDVEDGLNIISQDAMNGGK